MHMSRADAALIVTLVCVSISSITTVGLSEAAMQEGQEKAQLKALIESKMGDLYDKDLEEKSGRHTAPTSTASHTTWSLRKTARWWLGSTLTEPLSLPQFPWDGLQDPAAGRGGSP